MVIDRGAFLSGRYGRGLRRDLRGQGGRAAQAHLKVILETGELKTYDNVRRASRIAILGGADFIKTSTGKVAPASTRPVVLLMLETVRDHYLETGTHRSASRPPAGSGPPRMRCATSCWSPRPAAIEWLTPQWFRFGASSLLNDVLMQLEKQRTGALPTTDGLQLGLKPRALPNGQDRPGSAGVPRQVPELTLRVHLALRAGPREYRSRRDREPLRAVHRRCVRAAALRQALREHQPQHRTEARRRRTGEHQGCRCRRAGGRKALPAWRKLSGDDRARYLYRIARILLERAREFAVLETLDNGKPIKETRDVDVPLAAQHFFYHAGWADKLDLLFPGEDVQPIGVVGQVIPWNFPLLMAAWKIAPALAGGNTVVLKPAETSPLTALRLAEVFEQAELPPGVVNIVTGDGATGQALVRHPELDKVAFTGSTEVGKQIQKTLAGRGVDLTLELGGKAAHLVFEDAALDQAVEGVVRGIFFNQGHVCCAGSRLLVQESVHDVFVKKLQRRMGRIRVGDPLDKNTDMGAVHSKQQLARIRALVQAGRDEGAVLFQPKNGRALPNKGFWFAPSMFTGVAQSHRIAREEIFGPVLAVSTFRTPDEAVKKANDTSYGLSAGIWTDKGARILWLAARMRAGVVWNNTFNRFDAGSPFGGMRESGFGREGGRQGMRAYVRLGSGLLSG